MATDEDARYHRYCKDVCGGQCCHLFDTDEGEVPCPNLTRDRTCRIYHKRYAPGAPDLVQVGRFRSRAFVNKTTGKPALRPFMCGRVEQLLASGQIPKHIADQCVYAHPELIEKVES